MAKTTEVIIEKIYWTTGEVAHMLNISTTALRFWVKEFNLKVHRSPRKPFNRKFTKADIAELKQIRHLLLVERYTLEGVRIKRGITAAPRAVMDQEIAAVLRVG